MKVFWLTDTAAQVLESSLIRNKVLTLDRKREIIGVRAPGGQRDPLTEIKNAFLRIVELERDAESRRWF